MRTYNIYFDRIKVSFDNCTDVTLEHILDALSEDLFKYYLTLPIGQGTNYLRISYIIHDLVHVLDNTRFVDDVHVVGILRNSLSFLRRLKFPDFQINIINHV